MSPPQLLDVPAELRATVTWQDVVVTASRKGEKPKMLLDHAVGYVRPTQMVAIMGPSGSGKTTLLDTLAGRTPRNLAYSGSILVNGHSTKMSYGTVAYVPQDDLLTGTLTVRETLIFTSKLRMQTTASKRAEMVDLLLSSLGLTTAAHTPVGTTFIKGISGGQKRRLSIACEVLVGPAVLFLDEPTSGLDSASAYFCVQALKGIADQGRAIVMSIHQPSAEVFELFDQLLLLSSGQMIYFGDAKAAESAYQACDLPCPERRMPADHYIFSMNTDFQKLAADFDDPRTSFTDIEAPNPPRPSHRIHPVNDAASGIQRLRGHFEGTLRGGIQEAIEKMNALPGVKYKGTPNTVSAFSQTLTLTHRTLLDSTRDVGVFWLRLGMYLGLCICLGTVYFQLGKNWSEASSRGGLLFFTMAFLTFMSVSGFPVFVDNMKIFVRERLNGYYGVLPFTIANTVASAPFLVLMTIVCSVVVYYLAGLNTDSDRVIYFMINLFSALMVVESLMMAIAAVVPHYLLGLAAGAAVLGCFMPIAGYIIPVANIPNVFWRYPMHYLGYHTYSMNGLMANEFVGTDGWGCPCELQNGGCTDPKCTITGLEVVDALSYNVSRSKWWDILALAGMVFFYRAAFFGMLKLREARSK